MDRLQRGATKLCSAVLVVLQFPVEDAVGSDTSDSRPRWERAGFHLGIVQEYRPVGFSSAPAQEQADWQQISTEVYVHKRGQVVCISHQKARCLM